MSKPPIAKQAIALAVLSLGFCMGSVAQTSGSSTTSTPSAGSTKPSAGKEMAYWTKRIAAANSMIGLFTEVAAQAPKVALNTPPTERRYDTSVYPREAFNNRDPLKKLNTDPEIVPVR